MPRKASKTFEAFSLKGFLDDESFLLYCLDRELKGREEIIGGIFQSPWNADVNFDVN